MTDSDSGGARIDSTPHTNRAAPSPVPVSGIGEPPVSVVEKAEREKAEREKAEAEAVLTGQVDVGTTDTVLGVVQHPIVLEAPAPEFAPAPLPETGALGRVHGALLARHRARVEEPETDTPEFEPEDVADDPWMADEDF